MAQSKGIELVVVTPERQVLSQTVHSVVIPAHDGELGVLPGRASLMCELGIGQLRYSDAAGEHRLFIDGGFAQVHQNSVAVLTTRALSSGEITDDLIRGEEAAESGAAARPAAQRQLAHRRVSVMRALRPTRR